VKPRFIVGIDLGTTHTVVAYADSQEKVEGDAGPNVHAFPIPQSVAPGEVAARELLPSVRYQLADGELKESDTALPWGMHEDGAVVGELARKMGAKSPLRLIASAKSWLSHPHVDRTANILPWGASDDVAKISPIDASTSYLAHVHRAWNHAFPAYPLDQQEVVLTVPASFDEGARALTLEAATRAWLLQVRLVEEPQAAFYDFLRRHHGHVDEILKGTRLVLVCDVGGGTTDLTLIHVELRESGPRLTRIAVGDHLMLGGDNMDLALARRAETRIAGEGNTLPAARFFELLTQAREAKERLLAKDAPSETTLTVLGGGSKLIGGSKSTTVTRDEALEGIVDGFFPRTEQHEAPLRKRAGIVEFGLPYASDPAITRHIAGFLTAHSEIVREALAATGTPTQAAIPTPDAILLNGGVFKGHALVARLLEVLTVWRGSPPTLLDNDAPELAVARGAVAYGLARRGVGLRIAGGSPRSYYVVVDAAEHRAVCVLPRGSEEGEEVAARSRTFSLRLGEPVRFHVVTSHAEKTHRAGDLVEINEDSYAALPPIAAVLDESGPARSSVRPSAPPGVAREVNVELRASLTEVGTIELSCVSANEPSRRWKLEFQLRGDAKRTSHAPAATAVTQLHPRFAEAKGRIDAVFGKSSKDIDPKGIKTLRVDLERILGARETWDTALLRELFGTLLAGAKRRRRSADHERVWFNLAGYCLRPGFGYPLDDWRTAQLWELFRDGVQFQPEAQVWSEWWTMWRRVAGGLTEQAQTELLDAIAFYLEPPAARPKPRPKGPRMLGQDDMVRLAGSLERISPKRKTEVGDWLIERLLKHNEPKTSWWAVGRLGARMSFAASAHQTVTSGTAATWLEHVMKLDWKSVESAPFAATQLARATGDRERDIPEATRLQVADRLTKMNAPTSWAEMVREPRILEEADERRVFGESLPPGLKLIR
jgi:hypothetical protein